MSLIELQAWLPGSDLSAAPDATFSSDDQLVDAGFNPVLWGEGDGFLEIHADDPDAQYLQRRGFIRAVRTDTNEGLFWWILEEGSVKLLSNSGKHEKVIRWDGRGMLYYLDRYKLGQAVWAPGQPYRGSVSVHDYWTWVDQPMIAILTRFMEEGQNDTRAEFLNKLDYDFDRVQDSNGNSLAALALEEYQVRIGTGGLTLASDAMRQGNLLQVLPQSPPLLQAFRDVDEYRTDRSSATFAANKVRFAAAQNIATELPHKIVALRERTHTLTRRKDGQYATEDVDGSGVPYMEFLDVPFTSDPVAVEEVVSQAHLARQAQSTVAVIRHKLGPGGTSGAQGYFPSPAGHYWVGDLVTAHSGTGEYDLNEQALEVAGIRYFLRGADWMVEAQLGAQVINAAGGPVSVPNAGPTVPRGPDVRICRDPITGGEGEGPATRLYHHATTSGTGEYASWPSLADTDMATGWDSESAPSGYDILNSTPPETGSGGVTWTSGGNAEHLRFMWGFVSPPLGSGDLLSAIQNGANLRAQLLSRSRAGIGVDEAEQEDYAAQAVRLYRPGTGFIATLFATAQVNSVKLRASSTAQNRSWDATLSAFPGAASTDHLVIDYGIRHVNPTDDSCGATVLIGGNTTDLPRNNTTTDDNRSWVEIAEITSTASYPGSLPEPTVLPGEESHGDCLDVASCCHSHAHGEFGADGALHTFDQISGSFDYLQLPEGAAPSTPPSGTARIYVKSDGRVYSMDEGGTEYGPFDASGGGGPSTCTDLGGSFALEAEASSSSVANTTSHTVTLPTGITAGERLLIFCARDGGGTVAATGWTSVAAANSAGPDAGVAILEKIATGSEGSSVTVTTSASEKAEFWAIRVSGAHASTASEGSAQGNASSTTPTPPSHSLTGWSGDALWFAVVAMDLSSSAGILITGLPVPFSHRYQQSGAATDSSVLYVCSWYGTAAVPFSTNVCRSSSAEQNATALVAVRPA